MSRELPRCIYAEPGERCPKDAAWRVEVDLGGVLESPRTIQVHFCPDHIDSYDHPSGRVEQIVSDEKLQGMKKW